MDLAYSSEPALLRSSLLAALAVSVGAAPTPSGLVVATSSYSPALGP
jgi:hypothetical protein